MASTGAYRQVLQQVFVIPIEEDNATNTSKMINTNEDKDDTEEGGSSTFDEFADEQTENKNTSSYTEEYIDAEFAEF